MKRVPRRSLAAAILAIVAVAVAVAGSGCGGGAKAEGAGEVAAQVEVACTKLSSVAVWLPEHLAKTGGSVADAKTIVRGAEDEFRSTLASLDPPADLQAPLGRLASDRFDDGSASLAASKAALRHEAALYRKVGATGCAKGVRASLLTLEGASVSDAYRQVGLPLPRRPSGW